MLSPPPFPLVQIRFPVWRELKLKLSVVSELFLHQPVQIRFPVWRELGNGSQQSAVGCQLRVCHFKRFWLTVNGYRRRCFPFEGNVIVVSCWLPRSESYQWTRYIHGRLLTITDNLFHVLSCLKLKLFNPANVIFTIFIWFAFPALSGSDGIET